MSKKLQILLADDDSDDRAFFEQALRRLATGVNLVMVTDGRQVIDYLSRCGNSQMPSAVVFDYNMPFLNALQLLDWLESRSWFNGIHKFVWSTSNNQKYVDECISKGCSAYFVKPDSQFGIDYIIQKIVEVCQMEE